MVWVRTIFGSMFYFQGPSVTVDQRDAGILIQFVIRYSFASFSSHNKKIKYPMIGIKFVLTFLKVAIWVKTVYCTLFSRFVILLQHYIIVYLWSQISRIKNNKRVHVSWVDTTLISVTYYMINILYLVERGANRNMNKFVVVLFWRDVFEFE